jgi:hypothetical protein
MPVEAFACKSREGGVAIGNGEIGGARLICAELIVGDGDLLTSRVRVIGNPSIGRDYFRTKTPCNPHLASRHRRMAQTDKFREVRGGNFFLSNSFIWKRCGSELGVGQKQGPLLYTPSTDLGARLRLLAMAASISAPPCL